MNLINFIFLNKRTNLYKINRGINGDLQRFKYYIYYLCLLLNYQDQVKRSPNVLNSEMEVKIIQADRKRANLCCSRRELISENKKGDQKQKFDKYNLGDRVDDAVVKV